VDVDQLADVNESHSSRTGSQILNSVGQIASSIVGQDATVAKLAGRQIAMAFNDASPGDAAEVVERIRQTVEQATFQQGDEEIRVTVSAAAVTAQANDTNDQLVDRLCSTLEEAKSYGRNRTFLCEEDCPSPVVPPTVDVEERLIEI
jgi:diguanylate cyclase (GGDEF)-like protein